MIKEAIGTGATVEEAIENAKKALGAPESADVSTEVLELPKKKTLGLFGGAPAKAKAYYDAPEEKKAEPKVAAEKPAKASKPAEKPAKKEESKKIVSEPAKHEDKEYTGAVSEHGKKAMEYISTLLKGMGVSDFKINVDETDDGINIDLDCGSGYGYVIGRRGETLDAIQYLTRLVINKSNDDYKRISINAGNYRQKREDTLRELAKKQADRVKKYGRNVVLDPMNPYERRIIHTTVQEIEGVSSHSVGSESERKVVITLAEGFKPMYSSRRPSGRNDYRRRNSYNNNNAPAKPQRAPRSDFEGSLYGKIEPKKPQTQED